MTITENQRRTLDLMSESAGWNYGVSDEAREELSKRFAGYGPCIGIEDAREITKVILWGIRAEGYEIHPKDRMDALRHDAGQWADRCRLLGGGPVQAYRAGDLEVPS